MTYEKPQKRNPNNITIRQHVFPEFAIKNFNNSNGSVEFFDKYTKKISLKTSRDYAFCARRVWDDNTERDFMQKIEDPFAKLSKEIISGNVNTIDAEKQVLVTEFFCLWNIREHYREDPFRDEKINGALDVARKISKDEQEKLEISGVTAIRPDLTISSRSITGIRIKMNFMQSIEQMTDAKWGIVRSNKIEFLVPDNCSHARIMPISPKICLISEDTDRIADIEEVININKSAVAISKNYFFGRDLKKCGIS